MNHCMKQLPFFYFTLQNLLRFVCVRVYVSVYLCEHMCVFVWACGWLRKEGVNINAEVGMMGLIGCTVDKNGLIECKGGKEGVNWMKRWARRD